MNKKFNKKNIIEQLRIIRDFEIINNKPLKVKAYNKIIDNLITYPNDINDLKDLKEIKGIGVRILSLLTEFFETGQISYIKNKKDKKDKKEEKPLKKQKDLQEINKDIIIKNLIIIRDYELFKNQYLKVKAYNKVIHNIINYPNDIKDLKDLKEIKGVGMGILTMVGELYKKGKISYIENIIKKDKDFNNKDFNNNDNDNNDNDKKTKKYKLLDWIDINKLSWLGLSTNPNAIDLFKTNINEIIWNNVSMNINDKAIELLIEKPKYIKWGLLSGNNSNKAVEYLLQNLKKIDWDYLSMNSNDKAIDLLLTKPKKINWSLLCMNTNNRALELLLKNPEKIYWDYLSSNKNDIAVKLLLENIDKINWRFFSENSNDKAVNYLLQNPDKIIWNNFSSNINIKAFAFLLKNKDKIDWHYLSSNPLIFDNDNDNDNDNNNDNELNKINKDIIIQNLIIIRDYELFKNEIFKYKAYNKVIDNLYDYSGDIKDLKDLKDVKGVGMGILTMIDELYKTGSISYIETVIKKDKNYKIPAIIIKSKNFNKKTIIDNLIIIKNYENYKNEKYKVKAYTNVINNILIYNNDINDLKDFKKIDGIGKSIFDKIKELYETGKISYIENNINNDDIYTFKQELLSIHGIGPVKANQIVDSGIKSIDELLKNHLKLLNAKQKIGIKYYNELKKRIPLPEYIKHLEILNKDLKKNKLTFDFVGSYRRESKSMGDIDLLIMENPKFNFNDYIKTLMNSNYIIEVLAFGEKKFMGIVKLPNQTPRRLDILLSPKNEYYYSLLYFTGSNIFNIGFRHYVKVNFGLSLSEHGFDKDINTPINSEEDIFKFLKLKYVKPKDRESFYI